MFRSEILGIFFAIITIRLLGFMALARLIFTVGTDIDTGRQNLKTQ